MPAGIGLAQIRNLAGLGPGLADPVLLLDVADKIEQPAGRNEVVDEVPAGAQERGRLRRNVAHAFRGDQAPVGAAGEPWALRPEQHAPHRREDAVGGDQHVGFDLRAVVEPRPHLARVLLDTGAAVRQMHALRRHRPRQQRVQLAAVEDVMRRAELLFDIGGKPRLGQRAGRRPSAAGGRTASGTPPGRIPRRAQAGSGCAPRSG